MDINKHLIRLRQRQQSIYNIIVVVVVVVVQRGCPVL